jgi:hypothetical protein
MNPMIPVLRPHHRGLNSFQRQRYSSHPWETAALNPMWRERGPAGGGTDGGNDDDAKPPAILQKFSSWSSTPSRSCLRGHRGAAVCCGAARCLNSLAAGMYSHDGWPAPVTHACKLRKRELISTWIIQACLRAFASFLIYIGVYSCMHLYLVGFCLLSRMQEDTIIDQICGWLVATMVEDLIQVIAYMLDPCRVLEYFGSICIRPICPPS